MNEEKNIRDGYQFVGWFIDKECTKRINPGGKLPCTMTLYDKWVPILYPVEYKCGDGINSRKNPRYVTVESGAILLYPARLSGMIFDGWYCGGEKVTTVPEKVTHPIVLEAHFKKPAIVSFETNGGAFIQKKEVNCYGYLDEFIPPMRMGYEFQGWYWDKKLRLSYSFDQPIDKDCTLYAKWKLKEYTITYDVRGGISARTNPKKYTYFTSDINLLPAYKKGYVFDGWFDLRDNPINTIYANSMGDKHLVAHYHKKEGSFY